jgi:hypothetical protein
MHHVAIDNIPSHEKAIQYDQVNSKVILNSVIAQPSNFSLSSMPAVLPLCLACQLLTQTYQLSKAIWADIGYYPPQVYRATVPISSIISRLIFTAWSSRAPPYFS